VFAGVIVGLIGNGRLQRRDREARRWHDRKVMSSALITELSFLVKSYEDRVQRMENAQPYFDVPMVVETEVYDSLRDKIGLLEPEQGGKVIHAYLAAKHLIMDIRWLVTEVGELMEPAPDRHEGMMRVPVWAMQDAVRQHRDRIVLFKEAIAALRGN
jgi:hypothetical protein